MNIWIRMRAGVKGFEPLIRSLGGCCHVQTRPHALESLKGEVVYSVYSESSSDSLPFSSDSSEDPSSGSSSSGSGSSLASSSAGASSSGLG